VHFDWNQFPIDKPAHGLLERANLLRKIEIHFVVVRPDPKMCGWPTAGTNRRGRFILGEEAAPAMLIVKSTHCHSAQR
jgi:hypothetical protein